MNPMKNALFLIPVLALPLFSLSAKAEDLTTGERTTDMRGEARERLADPVDSADNTSRNALDRDSSAKTPLDQGNNPTDLDIAAQIRRRVVDDQFLSINGHNVKIIVQNREVTLRGPVASAKEAAAIVRKAEMVAGERHVQNELEVLK